MAANSVRCLRDRGESVKGGNPPCHKSTMTNRNSPPRAAGAQGSFDCRREAPGGPRTGRRTKKNARPTAFRSRGRTLPNRSTLIADRRSAFPKPSPDSIGTSAIRRSLRFAQRCRQKNCMDSVGMHTPPPGCSSLDGASLGSTPPCRDGGPALHVPVILVAQPAEARREGPRRSASSGSELFRCRLTAAVPTGGRRSPSRPRDSQMQHRLTSVRRRAPGRQEVGVPAEPARDSPAMAYFRARKKLVAANLWFAADDFGGMCERGDSPLSQTKR